MKFRMITTFFGEHSFGGDAAYVDRLSQALCRRGHEVHVYYCVDAFNAIRGDHPLRPYMPPSGIHLHPLKSRFGILSPLATQATGLPLLKTAELREALDDSETDVVHFHNISLVGGPGVLGLGANRRAVRIMTAHEHWLVCPMHLLWKYDRRPCDGPSCVSCSIHGRRPPQVWRATRAIERGLRHLDALIFPSRHALEEHRRRGLAAHVPLVHVPYFLPDNWSTGIEQIPCPAHDRPYVAAAGRLVKMKGFHRLIPLMKLLPEVDLRIAGAGPYEPELRAMAANLPNVRFEGLLGGQELAALFHHARAVVVPSLFPETFGYVVLEAFAMGTPVVVHEGGGALYETGFLSGGGLAYRTDTELLTAVRRMVHDRALHDELSASGFAMRMGPWSEIEHLDEYLGLIDKCQSTRQRTPFPRPHSLDRTNPATARADGLPWSDLGSERLKTGGINRPHGMI
jgi:glycosyltransferase involved in cell wall biosynthesis